MSEAPKTVWVTTWVLDSGIVLEGSATVLASGSAMVRLRPSDSRAICDPDDYHPTREAALARAEEMRAAKIASLKRQIERLESLEF